MAVVDSLIQERALHAIGILARHARVRAVYVFGSHVEGNADRFSDIDIAAFIENLEAWDLRRRVQAMATVQKEAGDDVELHLFPAASLNQPLPASFVSYILNHGVPLETGKTGP